MRPDESFIGQPIRSLQTMLRVLAKDDPTIPIVVPDGIYGQTTLGAVTEIQRRERLPITGITDQVTWERIVTLYDDALVRVTPAEPLIIHLDPGQELKLGDNGPYVYLIQSILIWLSQDHKVILAPEHSGNYDAATRDAVRAFQQMAGLPATGILDKITWKYLALHYSLNSHHNSKRQIFNQNMNF